MTSALGGGSPKSKLSKGGCVNFILYITTKGGGGQISQNIVGRHMYMPPDADRNGCLMKTDGHRARDGVIQRYA